MYAVIGSRLKMLRWAHERTSPDMLRQWYNVSLSAS